MCSCIHIIWILDKCVHVCSVKVASLLHWLVKYLVVIQANYKDCANASYGLSHQKAVSELSEPSKVYVHVVLCKLWQNRGLTTALNCGQWQCIMDKFWNYFVNCLLTQKGLYIYITDFVLCPSLCFLTHFSTCIAGRLCAHHALLLLKYCVQ